MFQRLTGIVCVLSLLSAPMLSSADDSLLVGQLHTIVVDGPPDKPQIEDIRYYAQHDSGRYIRLDSESLEVLAERMGRQPRPGDSVYFTSGNSTPESSPDSVVDGRTTFSGSLETSTHDASADPVGIVVAIIPSDEPPALASSSSQRSVAVVLLKYGPSGTPADRNTVEQHVYLSPNSLVATYREASYGKLEFIQDRDRNGRTDIFGPYTVTQPSDCAFYYGLANVKSQADNAALSAGVRLSDWSHVIYVLDTQSSCQFSGVSEVYGRHVFVNGAYHWFESVYSHEIGHNLGMKHAATDSDDNGKVDGTDSDYGDHSCIMANYQYNIHTNAPHKVEMAHLTPRDIVLSATGSPARLAPLDLLPTQTTSPQIVRFPGPDNLTSYYLSYRRPAAFDRNLSSQYGFKVSVHRFGGSRTFLVSTLSSGQSIVLSSGAIVRVDGLGDGYADVTVFAPSFADQPVIGDYDGDSRSEFAVFRSSTSQWIMSETASPIPFGGTGLDVPLPADYEGTGRNQVAVYRPSTAEWFVRGSNGSGYLLARFGYAGVDIPVPGDYRGWGKAQPAVFRPTTAEWYVAGGARGEVFARFGGVGGLDIPIPGTYDATRVTRPAVYRPSTSQWFVLGPQGSYELARFGQANVDIPVPADYNGIGRMTVGVYRPTSGDFFFRPTSGADQRIPFAISNGVPAVGDYDGDRKADPAVFNPSTGELVMRRSSDLAIVKLYARPGRSIPSGSWLQLFATRPSPRITRALAIPLPAWE